MLKLVKFVFVGKQNGHLRSAEHKAVYADVIRHNVMITVITTTLVSQTFTLSLPIDEKENYLSAFPLIR